MFNIHAYSTCQLQQICNEQVTRLTDRLNPGNYRLAQECLDEIVQREHMLATRLPSDDNS